LSKELLESVKESGVLVTVTVKNGWDVEERVEFAFKSLTRLYELRIFGKRKFKEIRRKFFEELRAYRQRLKELNFSPKEIERKVELQKKLFREFVNRYRNRAGAEKLKLGQILPIVWVFELTKFEKGYHPHWHGVGFFEMPKLLLTVLWREATKGEADITDIRRIRDMREAVKYLEDYVADFVDVDVVEIEEKLEVEMALYGRRKVRAWRFDLIKIKGQQFGEKDKKRGSKRIHLEEVKLISNKKNLHDYWEVRKKVKKGGRILYMVVELKDWDVEIGTRVVLVGYMTEEGIELEVKDGWEEVWKEYVKRRLKRRIE
jgi:hypothetical protein